jgi:LPS O-antigen subunit length determinant protein (WzzB/FepE family)
LVDVNTFSCSQSDYNKRLPLYVKNAPETKYIKMVKQICKAFKGLIENYKLNIKIDDRGIEWQIEQIRDRAKNKIKM